MNPATTAARFVELDAQAHHLAGELGPDALVTAELVRRLLLRWEAVRPG